MIQAMDRITENITKLIHAKIDTVLAAIKEQTSQIQELGIRVGEAESGNANVESETESLQGKVETLGKQVNNLLDILISNKSTTNR